MFENVNSSASSWSAPNNRDQFKFAGPRNDVGRETRQESSTDATLDELRTCVCTFDSATLECYTQHTTTIYMQIGVICFILLRSILPTTLAAQDR